jgi:hypothetical protein
MMRERPDRGHESPDAFMLMRYEGAGGRREWIWNSRDGVTPFCITSADDAVELHHGNWHLDRYEPRYVPPIGSRVFVDLTEELARPRAIEYVERYWDHEELPMREHPVFEPLGKAGAIEHFVQQWVADWGGHSPHLIVVTAALRAQFLARATEAKASP